MAARDPLEGTLRYQPGEQLAVDAGAGGLASRDDASAMGEAEETVAVGLGHVVKCIQ
jgi:hypothetical protein